MAKRKVELVSKRFLSGSRERVGDSYLKVKAKWASGAPCDPWWVKYKASGVARGWLRGLRS